MPIEFVKNSAGTVTVGRCFGDLSKADILASIDFAFDTHRVKPGIDRIVTADPDTTLQALDAGALRSIQQHILGLERTNADEMRFRSVLVHASPMQKSVMQLYKAIWDGLDLPGVEFSVVASEDEAWQILGATPFNYRTGVA